MIKFGNIIWPVPEGRQPGGVERLYQAEAGFLVVADNVAGDGAAAGVDQPHRCRLDDQIADGQHQSTVRDDDAVAPAFGAE